MSTLPRPAVGALPGSLAENPEIDLWIRVDTGGTVTLLTGKAELGQGLRAAIARIGAEELDVSLERIRVKTADTSRGPKEGLTAGSMSMEQSGRATRQVAAEARAYLLGLAAAELDASPDELTVDDGRIVSATGRETDYWRLLGGRRFGLTAKGDVEPKRPDEHRIVGRRGPRIDMRGIVTGTTRYVQDLAEPGVLFGRVVRPPSAGARLIAIDVGRARDLPGVAAVVRDGSFLAVAAEREDQVDSAAEVLRAAARWEETAVLPPRDVHRWLREQETESFLVVDGVPVTDPIPAAAAPPGAATTLSATYTRPYVMHGSIGPSAAMAQWREGELHVWSATQAVEFLRAALAEALGIRPDVIRVSHVEGAGCYGHNGADDVSLDAALLARAVSGRRVLLRWTREDEHAWEPYGPPAVVDLQASLDADGSVVAWSHEVVGNTHIARPMPGGGRGRLLASRYLDGGEPPDPPRPILAYHVGIHRNADPLYAFPRRRIVKNFVANTPIRVSSLRALGAFANVFAIESFMDELAEVAGSDPLDFRLHHLADERAREVLVAAAERAGWGEPLPEWTGRGLGFARYKNSAAYAAVAIQARVDDATAHVVLERAVIAGDAGEVVDPDGLENQLEGGLIQAASWTLKEQVRFDRQRITSVDWDSYPILRFDEVPQIETVLLDRPGMPYLGAGEATQGPTAAAIANAVYDAVGMRLRDLPLTPERLREAAAAA
jgi:CO/xanthine dehydrogenase Mo-binding subunit